MRTVSWSAATAWSVPVGVVAGSLAAHLLSALPPAGILYPLVAAGVVLAALLRTRGLGAALLAFCWSLWNFQLLLDDRLQPELSGQEVVVSGVISSIPQEYAESVSFRFEPDPRSWPAGQTLPRTVLVRWFDEWPPLSAGQNWRLSLLLRPPWGPVNFQGPDREKWLFEAGIGAIATVRSGQLAGEKDVAASELTRIRETVFRRIALEVSDPRAAAIVQALAVADRSGMTREDRQLLVLTGTSHLLAISGLHIGLAAAAGMLLTRTVCWLLPISLIGRGVYLLGLSGGVLSAGTYAALAGFGVSTLRALVMLLVTMAAVSASRSVHPARGWLLALAVVLLANPLAPLGPGFWFSFMAVAALLWAFVPSRGGGRRWRTLVRAQWAVMLVLLPFSALWFQGVSLVGFAANLVAIPAVSLLLVPLVLAGVAVLGLSGTLAGLLWWAAGGVSELLLGFLGLMAGLQGTLTTLVAPTPLTGSAALLGAAVLLLPRGVPGRWCGAFLLLPLFLPAADRVGPGAVALEVLDAGQGTSALLRTAGRSLLYDSGPGDGHGADLVASVVVPAIIRSGGGRPDRIIIGHGDLDHAGGLGSLLKRYPRAPVYANLARPLQGAGECRMPLQWRWGESSFEVLHPSGALPYRGNDSSCVIAIATGDRRVLLSGDISTAVEERLATAGRLGSDVLLVPHHGSATSSGQAFIQAVSPRIAVATAGLGNRFGFPRAEVVERYRRAGIPFWTTGDCGAIRILLEKNGRLTADSARRRRPGIWRWPAAPGCPDGAEVH